MNVDGSVQILNTVRRALPHALEVGAVDPEEEIDITVYIRRNPKAGALPPVDYVTPALPRQRNYEATSAAFSAEPQDLATMEAFAKARGLEVLVASVVKRSIVLRGTAAALMDTFKVNLRLYEYPLGRFRGRVGAVCVPSELDGIVEAVFGFDNRRAGRSYLRRPVDLDRVGLTQAGRNGYFPPQVAQLYNYPPGTDGAGQCIGIFAFNDVHHGGYCLEALRAYFTRLQIPMPSITDVVVSGAGNDPGDDGPLGDQSGDSSGEIMLDIQVAASIAPGARIAVYFTEFTERGWVDAIHAAVTDTNNSPTVLSISYGNPEDVSGTAWTRAAIVKVNEAFRIAAAKGITICCASGDQGSADIDFSTRRVHVDFPASSPFVLACGGTRLESFSGVVTRETVWNNGLDERGGLSAGGGGISKVFPLPAYQNSVGVPPSFDSLHHLGRGVPDVSGLADPETPVVIIRLNGMSFARVGGTSVTAPLWAALIARINQALGTRVGFLNPVLYSRFPAGVLRDIVQGTNGSYAALPGWDACTGLGSPDGGLLLQALSQVPSGLVDAFGRVGPALSLARSGQFACDSCGRILPSTQRSPYWSVYVPYWRGICSICYANCFTAPEYENATYW
jgi:kumamolisin